MSPISAIKVAAESSPMPGMVKRISQAQGGPLPSPADELLGEEPFLLLQKEQLPDEALKQGFPGRVRKPYGPAGQLLELVWGKGEFSAPFGDSPS